MLPRILAALLLTAFFVPSSYGQTPSPSPSPTQPVTITFWNVQWFPGRRPNASRAEENRQINAVH
ncbi:MAG: hypothetical protein QOD64_962, partial [Verrucomicrobiota bacterium]